MLGWVSKKRLLFLRGLSNDSIVFPQKDLGTNHSTVGDCCGGFTGTEYPPADASVDVTSDILAMINKFSNLPVAPAKSRVDVEPRIPDFQINISDVVFGLEGFSGLPYPPAAFGAPSARPCP